MGNTPSKPHHHNSSLHLLASKSRRRQHPQYNPDNESSSQLGQASSEHLQALKFGKWDTGTSEETAVTTGTTADKAFDLNDSGEQENKMKTCVVKEVYTVRETVDTARASIEAVRGSPAIEPGNYPGRKLSRAHDDDDDNESVFGFEGEEEEAWATVNEPYLDFEIRGIGSWIGAAKEPARKKQRKHK